MPAFDFYSRFSVIRIQVVFVAIAILFGDLTAPFSGNHRGNVDFSRDLDAWWVERAGASYAISLKFYVG